MDHLSAAQVGELRAVIEREIGELEMATSSVQAEARSADETAEQQDAAAQETGRLNAVAQAGRGEVRLAELRAALRRMQDGSYGLCEESEEEIPFARLRAEPTTRYTVEALEQLGLDGAAVRGPGNDRNAY